MPSCHRLGCAAEPASVPVPLFGLFITDVPNGVVTNGAQWGKLFSKANREGEGLPWKSERRYASCVQMRA